jgi:hypothetical protein
MYVPDRPFENGAEWWGLFKNEAQCISKWQEAIGLKLMTRNELECEFEEKPEPPISEIIPTIVATPTPAVTSTSVMTPADNKDSQFV